MLVNRLLVLIISHVLIKGIYKIVRTSSINKHTYIWYVSNRTCEIKKNIPCIYDNVIVYIKTHFTLILTNLQLKT